MGNREAAKPGKEPTSRDRVVVGEARTRRLALRDPRATGASLFVVVGLALTAIGVVDLALLWSPLGFGDAIWEFGTLSRTLDGVPLPALGLALTIYGLVMHPRAWPVWVRVFAVLFAATALALIVLALIWGTAVPEVLRQTPAEALGTLKRSIVKSVVQFAAYSLASGVMAWLLWRGARRTARGGER